MLRQPPIYATNETPRSIIGYPNRDMFYQFYRLLSAGKSIEKVPHKEKCMEILRVLRKNGFYPDGFDANGIIKWAVPIKSEVQILMESDLARYEAMSIPELQRIAREGFKKIATR